MMRKPEKLKSEKTTICKLTAVTSALAILFGTLAGCSASRDESPIKIEQTGKISEKIAAKKNPDVRQTIEVVDGDYYKALEKENFFLELPKDQDLQKTLKAVVGKNIKNYELYTKDGSTIKVSELLKDDKPLLLKVGASYCPYCLVFTKEMLDKYDEKEKELFNYVETSVEALPDVDENGKVKDGVSIERFLEDEKEYNKQIPKRAGLQEPLALTEDLALALSYEFIPTYYAVNRDGEIFLANYGTSYEEAKRSVLREPHFKLKNKNEVDKNEGEKQ